MAGDVPPEATADATERSTDGGATTAQGETFRDVDWDRLERRRLRRPGVVGALEFLALLGLVGAIAVDVGLLDAVGPPIPLADLGLPAIEWLFALVLLLGVFHVAVPLARQPDLTAQYWRRFRRNRVAVASLGFLGVVLLVGVVGPLVLRPPNELIDFGRAHLPPVFAGGTWAYPLGTDASGRPLTHLIVYGTRVSMEVGLVAAAISITIGTVVGATAAHYGGLVDEVLMRYVDLQATFPVFVLLLLLVYLYGPSLLIVVVLYGVFGWEGIGRLVRSEALQRSEDAYVRAAEASGAGRWWIVRRHLIPNVSSTVVTAATLSVPVFVLGEAALAFLGFSDPGVFSWGRTVAAGRGNLATAPWVSTLPGVALFLTVLAFNFVGDALRDAIDPRGPR